MIASCDQFPWPDELAEEHAMRRCSWAQDLKKQADVWVQVPVQCAVAQDAMVVLADAARSDAAGEPGNRLVVQM